MHKNELYFSLPLLLDQFSLSQNSLPANLKNWHAFLNYIETSLNDIAQERDFLKRSMESSAAEYATINERFEEAESIAHIGHWLYYVNEDQIVWSNEAYSIFGLSTTNALYRYSEFLNVVHEKDRAKLQTLVGEALSYGTAFELEMRIFLPVDQRVRWVLMRCRAVLVSDTNTLSGPGRFNLSGVVMDIDERKKNDLKLKKLNTKMIELSRYAGMSEVASSVLHNIGNILNSAIISLVVVQEKTTADRLLKLKEIARLLETGVEKKQYIFSDEKGNLIPSYLSKLSDVLLTKQKEVAQELEKLEQHLQHIASIVLLQNEIGSFAGAIEEISTEELLEQAIQMSYDTGVEKIAQVTSRIQFKTNLLINKTRVLQILINLLNNAKQAVVLNKTQKIKKIDIDVRESSEKGFFEIQVADNGVGIEKENISKIFSMGYTTKKKGHGFGLHMSAIAAHEMGGRLLVESPGANQGAVFTLILPIKCVPALKQG